MVHIKPTERETWASHASEAWYIGPAMHHYRCYFTWVWETRAKRVSDTLAWLPVHVAIPIPNSNDQAIAAASDLVIALQNPSPATALAPVSDNNRVALEQLAAIFADHTATRLSPIRPPPGFPPIIQPTLQSQLTPPPRVQTPLIYHVPQQADAPRPRVAGPATPVPALRTPMIHTGGPREGSQATALSSPTAQP